MNLLQRLKTRFQPNQQEQFKPLLSDDEAADIKATIETINAPLPPQPKGRVIKNTRQTEFNPSTTRRGGRVVKAMPRALQKIKEGQEKPLDDD